MNNDLENNQDTNARPVDKAEVKKTQQDPQEGRQRYIYSRKDAQDPTANLIDELLMKCNKKDRGSVVDFSCLVAYSIKLIKEAGIAEIQSNSLSDEDRANEELKKFNIKHGTNYTLFEFVLNGLGRKVKKQIAH